VKKDGVTGLAKAVGGGVHHLVKDTGEAIGDIAWEATHYEGDTSKRKIASRTLDIALNTVDAVTLVAGGVGAGKGLAKAASTVGATTTRGMETAARLLTTAPAFAGTGGHTVQVAIAGAKVTEAAIPVVAAGSKVMAVVKPVAATTAVMSVAGRGTSAPSSTSPQPTKAEIARKQSAANQEKLRKSKFGKELEKRYDAEKKLVDPNEFVDFSDYLYPHGPNDLNIGVLRGSRDLDFAAANKVAGYSSTPKGYTWHHHQDLGRMQLVQSSVHAAEGLHHSGGVSIWKKVFGLSVY
jgi:hypothetical protein